MLNPLLVHCNKLKILKFEISKSNKLIFFEHIFIDVPHLDEVNKLREDVSHGDSREQRTKPTDTQPKKKSESSAKVIFFYM